MQIEVKIDGQYIETKVVVYTAAMTEEVQAMLQKLGGATADTIVGFQSDVATILEPERILRVYAENQKVFAKADSGIFMLRMRLYEAEAVLEPHRFVRISNAEIINLRRVENMDLSMAGTICVRLQDGSTVYASRRFVPKIKAMLGI